ncbi:hypothetical protein EO95_06590 [Methanosarcina sp. 1.H.T.1A.1]|uniref:hypothetical protein n=1 Tax=Methanosarcina sp. 1.H.T.1A.1 TaxID=1483602 RepID=UPI0006223042|nr:hypothetical protein [Methanosarcina sp. 1.H.T.1A.1]KKH97019.1 hypothetical protein EO95_06590 [Methanosarcina sp. 1.H.T.1A.1]
MDIPVQNMAAKMKSPIIEGMKRGIDEPANEIAEQRQKGLIPSGTDPRTLAVALVSLFNGMRVMILSGVDWEEARSRWIEILLNLFGITEERKQANCPRDCKRFEDCNKVSRGPEVRAEAGINE